MGEDWLLLTHAVGSMRQYSIGASLLSLNDPSKVIGQTREPLMVATEEERSGYVPNVVYSCGGMIHRDTLIIPYLVAPPLCATNKIALERTRGTAYNSSQQQIFGLLKLL